MELADVIDKVQKLLNLANSSDKPGEVATAQLMAQKLITKYQLEEAQLHGRIKSDDITSMTVPIADPYFIDKATLLNSIALPNFCKVLRGNDHCVVYGYHSDIELCVALYRALEVHMVSEMQDKLALAKKLAPEHVHANTWAKSFFAGYAISIGERIKQAKSETIEDAGTAGSSLELVLRDKQHAIENYWQKLVKDRGSKRKLTSISGYQAGKESAATADLNQTKIESE